MNAPRYRSVEEMPEKMRLLFQDQYLAEHTAKQARQKAREAQPAPVIPTPVTSPAGGLGFKPHGAVLVGTDHAALDALNKTERRYYDLLRTRPDLVWIGVHVWKLRLAANTYFTPDFTTLDSSGCLTMIDTKGGFTREDAQLKLKLVARTFPMFRIVKAVWEKGRWNETVLPA
ncbi:hypothetical protein [Thiocapsa sp. N5-Cardenillas]|uniref:hypothetical protein n=1 Tax=Thiocapsa sp. N5-Cardenillas TaxID=3137397 RepID=UPI0035B067CF